MEGEERQAGQDSEREDPAHEPIVGEQGVQEQEPAEPTGVGSGNPDIAHRTSAPPAGAQSGTPNPAGGGPAAGEPTRVPGQAQEAQASERTNPAVAERPEGGVEGEGANEAPPE